MTKPKSLRRTVKILMATTVALILCVVALTIYENYLANKEYQRKTTDHAG